MEKWIGYRMTRREGGHFQEQVVTDTLERACQWLIPTIRTAIAHEKLFVKATRNDRRPMTPNPPPYEELEQLIQREAWMGVYQWLQTYRFRHGIPGGVYPVPYLR